MFKIHINDFSRHRPAFQVTVERRPVAAFRRFETLNQHHLRKSDFVKLVSKFSVCQVENIEQGVSAYSEKMQVTYGSRQNVHLPFPPETHGFFYYWANPDIPAEGQIRFRVTRDSDPSSFANGHDLLGMDGLPWCITLFQALNISKYGPLGELLVKENLVTEGIAEQARSAHACQPDDHQALRTKAKSPGHETWPGVPHVSRERRIQRLDRSRRRRLHGHPESSVDA